MSEAFVPQNDLEKALVLAQNEQLHPDEFMGVLMNSEVFMPVRPPQPEDGAQSSEQGMALIIDTPDGAPVVVVFSSTDRADPEMQKYPEFEGGFIVDLPWVLKRIGDGVGISLNLGCEYGIDFSPQMVDLMRDVAEQMQAADNDSD